MIISSEKRTSGLARRIMSTIRFMSSMPSPSGTSDSRKPSSHLLHGHVLEVDVERPRRELLHRLDRIVEDGQVVAGIEADAEVFAAVLLQQRDLLIDAPVLVVLDAERHPVPLDDRQRRRDLLVESGDGGASSRRAIDISS